MSDQRKRSLGSGLQFNARPCHGMFTPTELIQEGRGERDGGLEGDETRNSVEPVTHLKMVVAGDPLNALSALSV